MSLLLGFGLLHLQTSSTLVLIQDGSLGILNNHAPLVTTLREGEVVVKNDKNEQTFARGQHHSSRNTHFEILTF